MSGKLETLSHMSNLKKYINNKGQSVPHLYHDELSGVFFVILRVGHRIKKRSLKTKEYLEALRSIPTVLSELSSKKEFKSSAPNKLIKEYWEEFRTERESFGVADDTLRRMGNIWDYHLEPYFGNWPAHDIYPEMMPKFISWHNKNSPGVLMYGSFKYLKALLNYMLRVEAITSKQIPMIKLPRKEQLHHEKKKGRVVTPDEFNKLIESATTLRIELIIQISYYTGMRKMEIVSLERDRVVEENRRYFLILENTNTKTRKARSIPLPDSVSEKMREYLRYAKTPFLFPKKSGLASVSSQLIDRDWNATKKKAKIIGRLRFHDLRHTCATNLARTGTNPILASTLLGMSIKTYQDTYLNLKKEDLILTVDNLFSGVDKK